MGVKTKVCDSPIATILTETDGGASDDDLMSDYGEDFRSINVNSVQIPIEQPPMSEVPLNRAYQIMAQLKPDEIRARRGEAEYDLFERTLMAQKLHRYHCVEDIFIADLCAQ